MSGEGIIDAPKMETMDGSHSRKSTARLEAVGGRGEDTPTYQILKQHGLLDTSFRLDTSAQMDAVPGNATVGVNCLLCMMCCPCWACKCFHVFDVDAGKVAKVTDGRGGFEFHAQGVHRICDPFYRVGEKVGFQKGVIQHGDLTIAVVGQGEIGYVSEKGQPILLPPGLHQWRSTTMIFETCFSLNNNIIRMGPLTLVTVDSGYSALTEDNGMQKVLAGGATYLLSHKNWKFQKYISEKIQSDNLKRIEATSADNVLMAVDATVIWRIADVQTAALNSADTIAADGGETKKEDINSMAKLRNDVLKQAEASLAAFIGAVNYSGTFNVAAVVQKSESMAMVEGRPMNRAEATASANTRHASANSSPLFDCVRMQTCLDHANAVTCTYGVKILSINVVSAVPADKQLMVSLAQGAVAAAEAQKFEIVASGKAAAAKIEAKGFAEAEVMRSEGHRAAADKLASNSVAVRLAAIQATGQALGQNKAYFFGADPKDLGSLLAASVVSER